MTAAILLYSTVYHLRQKKLITDKIISEIQIGVKSNGFWPRLLNFFKAIFICLINNKQKIYIPRAGSKDIWIIYLLFKSRCILISDGLSDCLPNIKVFGIHQMFGFAKQVDPKFHVLNLPHRVLSVYHSNETTEIALFTKRGRDYDYVNDYAASNFTDIKKTINPNSGNFCLVLVPASTIVFELLKSFPKEKIFVVSHSVSYGLIPHERRIILRNYEEFLEAQGCNIIR
jgi:hypothetical protein